MVRDDTADALQFDVFAEPAPTGDDGDVLNPVLDPVLDPVVDPAPRSTERERRAQGLRMARQALEADVGTERAAGQEPEPPAPRPGAAPDTALTIADFYELLHQALRLEFPDDVWVTGEIRKVSMSKGHRFIELADPSAGDGAPPPRYRNGWSYGYAPRQQTPMLDVVCWSREWPTIAAELDAVGLELVAGLVVKVRGRVSAWEGASRIRFSMSALDVEGLLGGIAAARRKLLSTLEAEGILQANRRLPAPPVPLRVGVVTSAGSEALRDFRGQLERSGLAFEVHLESSLVQGAEAPLQIAAALKRLARKPLDVIVLTRGGGAKGDLAAFDHEAVARAILASPYPVWTGIGHTGDRSVADEVAHRALVTPTACGEAVVDAVASYLEGVATNAARLVTVAQRVVDVSRRELAARRSELSRAARHEVTIAAGTLAHARGRVERGATVTLERCSATLVNRSNAVASSVTSTLTEGEHHLRRQRALLAAYDPHRQLERGWSLTRRRDGSIVRSVDAIAPGEEIVTVVADGAIVSETRSIERAGREQQSDPETGP